MKVCTSFSLSHSHSLSLSLSLFLTYAHTLFLSLYLLFYLLPPGSGGIESRHIFLSLLHEPSISLLLQSFQIDSLAIAKEFGEREREFVMMEVERERESCDNAGMLGKEELLV